MAVALSDRLDEKGDFAKLDEVAFLDAAFAGGKAVAVEKGAVGASEVAELPAGAGEANFRVAATDGVIVEDDVELFETAGAQQCGRLPDLAVDFSVDATKANRLSHRPRTPQCSGESKDWRS